MIARLRQARAASIGFAALALTCCSKQRDTGKSNADANVQVDAQQGFVVIDALRDAGVSPEELDSGAKLLGQAARRGPSGERPEFSYAGLERGEVASFLDELQRTLREHDQNRFADLVQFPLPVGEPGKKGSLVHDRDELRARYDEIVTPRVAESIRRAQLDDLAVNWEGVKIGPGLVWIAGVCGEGSTLCAKYRVRVVGIYPHSGEHDAGPLRLSDGGKP